MSNSNDFSAAFSAVRVPSNLVEASGDKDAAAFQRSASAPPSGMRRHPVGASSSRVGGEQPATRGGGVTRARSLPLSPARAAEAEAKRRAKIAAELQRDSMQETFANSRALYVHHRQRKNHALLAHVTNVPVKFATNFVPDFLLGNNACALFLSIKYHRLHPNYIKNRVGALGKGSYRLRVILALVDVEDFVKSLQDVTRFALLNDCTVVAATSNREAARYLETYKLYESKKAEEISTRKAKANDVLQQVTDVLTKIPGVNKTDALNLLTAFGSIRALFKAPTHELSLCPGIGPTKAQRLHEAFTDSLNRLKRT